MKNLWMYILTGIYFLFGLGLAQDSLDINILKQRIKILEEQYEQSELDKILEDAEKKSQETKKDKTGKIFKSGQRSLQAINPEISITGDAFAQYVANEDGFNEQQRNGAYFRVLSMHIQSNPDPFSKIKVALEFTPQGIEFGEAYMTWNNVLPGIDLTAGKFRQQFGVVNRWHKHALDQFDFPLALQTIFGEDGLNQIGLSLDLSFAPVVADANSFVFEITNGQNKQLFGGDDFSFPAILGRFNNYFDLTANTYMDIGLTGMLGTNHFRGYNEKGQKTIEDTRYTKLAGMDITLFWEPLNKAKYHSFLWRTELYYADKDELVGANITTMGGYSYVEYRLNEYWQMGTRLDYTQPFVQDNDDLAIYQVVPYVTWWESHWVKMRLEYDYVQGVNMDDADSVLRLQLGWAVGPHKHDRY